MLPFPRVFPDSLVSGFPPPTQIGLQSDLNEWPFRPPAIPGPLKAELCRHEHVQAACTTASKLLQTSAERQRRSNLCCFFLYPNPKQLVSVKSYEQYISNIEVHTWDSHGSPQAHFKTWRSYCLYGSPRNCMLCRLFTNIFSKTIKYHTIQPDRKNIPAWP